jgi:hypothetical protein
VYMPRLESHRRASKVDVRSVPGQGIGSREVAILNPRPSESHRYGGSRVAEERFARGEITVEDLQRIRSDLEGRP